MALTKEGRALTWGCKSLFECNMPCDLANVFTISCGLHSVAVTEDGTLLAWGLNNGGQCYIPKDLRIMQTLVVLM
jgi:alpha-tubulin suppressor-like RCC1 family protein